MKVTEVLALSATLSAVSASPVDKRAGGFMFTGVNEACAEFGNDVLPGQLGKHYTWPVESAMKTLMDTGMNTFRIATMMERIVSIYRKHTWGMEAVDKWMVVDNADETALVFRSRIR